MSEYSARRIRFLEAHREEYEAAYYGGSGATLAKLEREYACLPSRHLCSCWCTCRECSRLRDSEPAEKPAYSGRRVLAYSPVPYCALLDIARAKARGYRTPTDMARFLNGQQAA